jgi:hypothetical protein
MQLCTVHNWERQRESKRTLAAYLILLRGISEIRRVLAVILEGCLFTQESQTFLSSSTVRTLHQILLG